MTTASIIAVDDSGEYALYEETAKAWLADWGSYWYKWRDRDELGFPRVNVLHESHGVGGKREDIPDMPDHVLFVDSLFRKWNKLRRAVSWIVWVDEAGEMQGWQRDCLSRRYGIRMWKEKFSSEIRCVVSSVAAAVMIAESMTDFPLTRTDEQW